MDETPIRIAEYDPEWAARFEEERERLQPWIGEYTDRIEHIGSTSVPGLGAKPIIDVTGVVTDVEGLLGNLDKLKVVLGYELSHIPSDWLLLQRLDATDQLFNLHLIGQSSDQWKHDILFREYLRANPDVRDEYEAVKREAATVHRNDIDGYNAAKSEFCRSVQERALTDDSIDVPDQTNGEEG